VLHVDDAAPFAAGPSRNLPVELMRLAYRLDTEASAPICGRECLKSAGSLFCWKWSILYRLRLVDGRTLGTMEPPSQGDQAFRPAVAEPIRVNATNREHTTWIRIVSKVRQSRPKEL
jgi:hypothetical protein